MRRDPNCLDGERPVKGHHNTVSYKLLPLTPLFFKVLGSGPAPRLPHEIKSTAGRRAIEREGGRGGPICRARAEFLSSTWKRLACDRFSRVL
jgi:hypothetical protein